MIVAAGWQLCSPCFSPALQPLLQSQHQHGGVLTAYSTHCHITFYLFLAESCQTVLHCCCCWRCPPQVVQVVCCKLTPLQQSLYEHFLLSNATRRLLSGSKATGVLSAITCLKKLCNHPKLIYDTLHSKAQVSGTQAVLSRSVLSRAVTKLACIM